MSTTGILSDLISIYFRVGMAWALIKAPSGAIIGIHLIFPRRRFRFIAMATNP